MIFKEYIRYLILGSPIYMPNISALSKIFRYEMTNSHFFLFLLITGIYIFAILLLINKQPNVYGLALMEGVLLLFCALCLNRLSVINKINFPNNHSIISSILNTEHIDKIHDKMMAPTKQHTKTNPVIDIYYLMMTRRTIIAKQLTDFADKLAKLQKSVNEKLQQFSSEFKKWKILADTVDHELSVFDSSPRYFEDVVKELKFNIDNYFKSLVIHKHQPTDTFVTGYIAKMNDSKRKRNNVLLKGRNDEILRGLVKLRYLYVIVAIIAIVFLTSSLVENYQYFVFDQRFICLTLILLGSLNVVVLICVQVLDRNCMIGRSNNCDTLFVDNSEFFAGTTKEDFEIFARHFNEYLSEVVINTQYLQRYLRDLLSEKVQYKILVFKNLFDKIIFVKEDFDTISKGSVHKDEFYKHINRMYSILDAFTMTFDDKLKYEYMDIYNQEFRVSNFLIDSKDLLLSQLHKVIKREHRRQKAAQKTRCGNALNDICTTKNMLEDVFNLTVLLNVGVFVLLLG